MDQQKKQPTVEITVEQLKTYTDLISFNALLWRGQADQAVRANAELQRMLKQEQDKAAELEKRVADKTPAVKVEDAKAD